jgi:hypothetical protein
MAGEDDGETAGGGARPLLRSWRPRLLSWRARLLRYWSGRGRLAGRETSSGASPGPAGGGAGPAPSRPLDFETRTAGGEDTF